MFPYQAWQISKYLVHMWAIFLSNVNFQKKTFVEIANTFRLTKLKYLTPILTMNVFLLARKLS